MSIRKYISAAIVAMISIGNAKAETDPRLHSDGQAWGVHQDTANGAKLPRVLLIGDSILNGYQGTVKAQLKGKASVDVWVTGIHEGDPTLPDQLRKVLAKGPYDLIHFNIGLHGWPKGRIKDGEYEPLMRNYVKVMKEGAPKAVLIWASSTPVTVKGQPTELNADINPVITGRNAAAAKIMRENGVLLNDLYEVSAKNLKLASGDMFHWTNPGKVLQGSAVATSILTNLPVPREVKPGQPPDTAAAAVFAEREGALVMLDCGSGQVTRLRPETAAQRFPPCSTFKIWNTLIGLKSGNLTTATAPFYQWDGQERFIPEWNRDMSLREAFQSSCVPAFQDLARKIGAENMRAAINQIGYGSLDMTAGVDCFWLPAPGRRTILISPDEQVELLQKLISGTTPFSAESIAVLKTVMKIRETSRGTLYGKTGSGTATDGKQALGWYVGWVENKQRTVVFACLLLANKATGKDARAIVEEIVEKQGLL